MQYPAFRAGPGLATAEEPRNGRLLAAMAPLLSDDLPHQLVVVQGLLQLLEQEEASRFREEALEVLRRLVGATRKAAGLVRTLQEMACLPNDEPHLESYHLAGLARELRNGLSQDCPEKTLDFTWDWEVAWVLADARRLGPALRKMLHAALETLPEPRCLIRGHSQVSAGGAEIALDIIPEDTNPPLLTGRPRRPFDRRPEFLLARECLHATGAALHADGDTHFILQLTV